jgi:anaerobic selenocysteine-containing dehydrogenase
MSSELKEQSSDQEKIITTICNGHCGGCCVLKVHVKGGMITHIETGDGQEPQLRACLKGRAYRQRVYAPDRLLYPLRRVGKRGEGKFERVSWDEALETVAAGKRAAASMDSYLQGFIYKECPPSRDINCSEIEVRIPPDIAKQARRLVKALPKARRRSWDGDTKEAEGFAYCGSISPSICFKPKKYQVSHMTRRGGHRNEK